MRTRPGRPLRIPLGPWGFLEVDLAWTLCCFDLTITRKSSVAKARRDMAAAQAYLQAAWEAMTPEEREAEDRELREMS